MEQLSPRQARTRGETYRAGVAFGPKLRDRYRRLRVLYCAEPEGLRECLVLLTCDLRRHAGVRRSANVRSSARCDGAVDAAASGVEQALRARRQRAAIDNRPVRAANSGPRFITIARVL